MTTSITEGFCAGLIATVPMTAAMASIRKGVAGKDAPLPMEEVGDGVAAKLEIKDKMTQDDQDTFNWISHFGFGAVTGGIYGLIAGDPTKHSVAKGIGFGMAVWATSYVGVLPALDIMREPEDEPDHKIASEVVSHVVWGAALGLLTKALKSRKPQEH
ncbi:MAG: DUF1440 domain-containing protein [Proteobacteria bacterium]|nr:MAG: DUF1440 domain-containing protein [Pseudomonadota bacterium]